MGRSRVMLSLLLVLAAGSVALRGDADFGARARRLGQQLICTCGCTQGALVCNHVGCPVVTQMRAEISARAQSTDSDGLILQSFVQEYGTQVLAVPTRQGFNLVAWIMPWVALGLGLIAALFFIQRWRLRPAAATPSPASVPPPPVEGIRAEIAAELERELGSRRHP
ncbi:MAG TPA: cytochrome c-type biogenesis protein CcmH [Terriglobales bacterium]